MVDHYRINDDTSFPFSAAVLSLLAGEHHHPPGYAFYPELATGERACDWHGARPYRQSQDPSTHGLTDYLPPPTYCNAVVDCHGHDSPETSRPRLRAMHRRSTLQARSKRILQDIMNEVLAQGVWIIWARRMRGQELIELRLSICLAVTLTTVLSLKVCKRAPGVIKAVFTKVLTERR